MPTRACGSESWSTLISALRRNSLASIFRDASPDSMPVTKPIATVALLRWVGGGVDRRCTLVGDMYANACRGWYQTTKPTLADYARSASYAAMASSFGGSYHSLQPWSK